MRLVIIQAKHLYTAPEATYPFTAPLVNHHVKDTQNLDTLVFCFTSLMTVEAPVLFGVYTNLTLFYICFYFCCNVAYPNLYFPNYALSYFSFCFSFVSYD